MRIISFSWTTPALVTGNKNVTRREWNDGYARQFRAGEQCLAYDRSPRVGGKPVGVIELTQAPELSEELPEADWQGEGFDFLSLNGITLNGTTPLEMWEDFRARPLPLWVVRFRLVSLNAYGREIARRFE